MATFKFGIYEHWKGSYYRAYDITYHHETGEEFVSYYKCDRIGVFQSIRSKNNTSIIEVRQPFFRSLKDFTKLIFIGDEVFVRFRLLKEI